MIKKTNNDKINKAQVIAIKALSIFKKTLDELNKSNEVLLDVIKDEEYEMMIHKATIADTEYTISQNTEVIKKLQEFFPNM